MIQMYSSKIATFIVMLLCFPLSCLSQAPNWDWSQSSSLIWTRSIDTDAQGNLFLAGFFEDKIAIGNSTYTAIHKDGVVAKYDRSGNVVWSKFFSGNVIENIVSIACDTLGN